MTGLSPATGRGLALRFLLASVVFGVLLAGLAIPSVGFAGKAASDANVALGGIPTEALQRRLSERSKLYANDGKTVVATFYKENREFRRLTDISSNLRKATLAVEDARFYEHGGVDPIGILRALINNATSGDTQGASTLTQQYVKNLLIEYATSQDDKEAAQAARAQSYSRKLREMKIALSLEGMLSKNEILEGYLNIAYYSNGAYGAEAAAQRYFSKPATQLTISEAAMLAGIVQRPGTFDPIRNPEATKTRRDIVLRRMLDIGYITPQEHSDAVKTELNLTPKRPLNGCANAGVYGFFCDYVQNLIIKSPEFADLGESEAEREDALMRGGLEIYSTIDPAVQLSAAEALEDAIPAKDPSQLGTAAVTMEPGTGKILAMAQNRRYMPSDEPGDTTINYSTTGWQTGSTFKPFVLATWLRAGKSLNEIVSGSPRTFQRSAFTCYGKPLRGESWTPGNAESNENGPMTVEKATMLSVNVAFVDMAVQLDMCDIADTAEAIGVRLAKPVNENTRDCSDQTGYRLPRCIPPMILGTEELTPLTMAGSYATFASGGRHCEAIAITSIKRPDPEGGPDTNPRVPTATCKQTITPEVASGVTAALKKVMTNGTAARTGPVAGHPSAGKTGTTNGPMDTWFVGYTAQRVTAVWVGDPGRANGTRRVLRNIKVGDRGYGIIYGGTIAAPIWKKIMTTAQEGMPSVEFGTPPANLTKVDRIAVPSVLGKNRADAISILKKAGFRVNVSNKGMPSKYAKGQVARMSPGPGSLAVKGQVIDLTLSTGTTEQAPPAEDTADA